jgi:hypothetical protein
MNSTELNFSNWISDGKSIATLVPTCLMGFGIICVIVKKLIESNYKYLIKEYIEKKYGKFLNEMPRKIEEVEQKENALETKINKIEHHSMKSDIEDMIILKK